MTELDVADRVQVVPHDRSPAGVAGAWVVYDAINLIALAQRATAAIRSCATSTSAT